MGHLICILEREPLTARLMSELLDSEGFTTFVLADAAGALDAITERGAELLVLDTDLGSPGTGWALLKAIKADNGRRDVPVIICTSDVAGTKTRAGLLAEPPETRVFIKPFVPQALISAIGTMLPTQQEPAGQSVNIGSPAHVVQ